MYQKTRAKMRKVFGDTVRTESIRTNLLFNYPYGNITLPDVELGDHLQWFVVRLPDPDFFNDKYWMTDGPKPSDDDPGLYIMPGFIPPWFKEFCGNWSMVKKGNFIQTKSGAVVLDITKPSLWEGYDDAPTKRDYSFDERRLKKTRTALEGLKKEYGGYKLMTEEMTEKIEDEAENKVEDMVEDGEAEKIEEAENNTEGMMTDMQKDLDEQIDSMEAENVDWRVLMYEWENLSDRWEKLYEREAALSDEWKNIAKSYECVADSWMANALGLRQVILKIDDELAECDVSMTIGVLKKKLKEIIPSEFIEGLKFCKTNEKTDGGEIEDAPELPF